MASSNDDNIQTSLTLPHLWQFWNPSIDEHSFPGSILAKAVVLNPSYGFSPPIISYTDILYPQRMYIRGLSVSPPILSLYVLWI